jgi:outer membrane immunogenic protein
MRKLVTVAVVAAFSGGATVAVAADLGGMPPEPMPVPAPMLSNWSGFYLGLGVGGGEAFSNVKTTNNTVVSGLPNAALLAGSTNQNFDLGAQGALGTAQIGYDYQFPMSRWVTGVFGDFDWSNAHSKQSGITYVDGVTSRNGVPYQPASGLKTSFDNEWSVGGRLGYLITPETYLYGLAAYTQGQVSVNGYTGLTHLAYAGSPTSYEGFSDTKTSGGWSAGLGLETHLRDNWYLKLEYRYSQFGGGNVYSYNSGIVDYTNGGAQVASCAAGHSCYNDYKTVNVDTDVQTARVVLSYKFNRQPYYDPMK